MEPNIYKPSIYNGAGIYNTGANGGGGGGGGVPAEYFELPFLTSNSSNSTIPYSQLNVTVNSKDIIELIFDDSGVGSSASIYPFERDGSGSNKRSLQFDNRYGALRYYNTPINYFHAETIPKGQKNLVSKKNSMILNGVERTFTTSEPNDFTNNIQFFFWTGNQPYTIILYKIIVKDENESIKNNFIPVQEISTGNKGLFDTISQTFFYLSNYQN